MNDLALKDVLIIHNALGLVVNMLETNPKNWHIQRIAKLIGGSYSVVDDFSYISPPLEEVQEVLEHIALAVAILVDRP